ncbi:helix-turn-helix domain-containing protein [Dongia sp.]|uniref:helix-turn-helix domain-containing protein n=1 Tax=Dongia sp. TaxID=1977262 RepID=UPI0035AFD157
MLSQQFLSVKDVADLLKVGETGVRSWIKHGDLRAVDVGREWRIAPRDLESFLLRHANRPPDDTTRQNQPKPKD